MQAAANSARLKANTAETTGAHVDLSPVVAAIAVARAVVPPAITGAVETPVAAKAIVAAHWPCVTRDKSQLYTWL